MPEIDVRLNTSELSLKLVLQTERSYGPVLDIELAKGVTVNGTAASYREFFQEGLDLVDMVAPKPDIEYGDLPVVTVIEHRFSPSFEQEQEAAGNDRYDQERDR
jgi:hypothetical protein